MVVFAPNVVILVAEIPDLILLKFSINTLAVCNTIPVVEPIPIKSELYRVDGVVVLDVLNQMHLVLSLLMRHWQ